MAPWNKFHRSAKIVLFYFSCQYKTMKVDSLFFNAIPCGSVEMRQNCNYEQETLAYSHKSKHNEIPVIWMYMYTVNVAEILFFFFSAAPFNRNLNSCIYSCWQVKTAVRDQLILFLCFVFRFFLLFVNINMNKKNMTEPHNSHTFAVQFISIK